ncbi:MAG TPA: FkbM family methyltransferase [Saprospiraceae bacterium]|nr:FkbM family methyltransferase [Saprospiraceae bacterium]HPN69130.1 FkbM family methyltransferase [Saprospiraceae bacterium]
MLKVLLKILSIIKSQKLWEKIYQLSLKQMNYGTAGDFNQSGELFVANYIHNNFKKEPSVTIFDVGANVGHYSEAIAKVFGAQAKIYAFEPSQKTYEILLETTKKLPGVILNQIGFSDKEYNQTLYSNMEGSGLASVYQRKLDHFGIKMDVTEEIQLTTIDQYCLQNGIDRIHFLKLDIEGHEISALNGAKNMLEKGNIDFIQFEFGGSNIDSRTYFQDFFYILKDRYKIYRILTNGIYELPAYKEIYEIFQNVNYLAIKK